MGDTGSWTLVTLLRRVLPRLRRLPDDPAATELDDLFATGVESPSHGYVPDPPLRQCDGRSCGSAALLVLAAARDPALAAWLGTGRREDGWRSPLLDRLPEDAWRSSGVAERAAAAQHAVLRRTNRLWPRALGTPPWGAARTLSMVTGRSWGWWLVDPNDAADLASAVEAVRRHASAGQPVPVYVGGYRSRGLSRTVPRHVVLVLGARNGRLQVFEPASGAMHDLAPADLLRHPRPPLPALGGWSTVHAVVLPA